MDMLFTRKKKEKIVINIKLKSLTCTISTTRTRSMSDLEYESTEILLKLHTYKIHTILDHRIYQMYTKYTNQFYRSRKSWLYFTARNDVVSSFSLANSFHHLWYLQIYKHYESDPDPWHILYMYTAIHYIMYIICMYYIYKWYTWVGGGYKLEAWLNV